jgi:DNA (cytosine-5)-methyltransferase 1
MIGSLFSGIGGLELGLERAGLGPTLWQVERDEFCQRVLAKHWPDAERFDDVRTVGAANLAPVDVICGGFPCQDVSSAGKGAGLAGERSGLWREFARVVGELRPRFVVVENVASGATRWFDEVVCDLEQRGYGCLPVPLSAFDVGAPHMRKRIFIVAHANGCDVRKPEGAHWRTATEPADVGETRAPSDADSEGESASSSDGEVAHLRGMASRSPGWPSPPELRRMDDGIPNRMDRLRALGNAVVPQCAEVVGWVIREL